MEDLTRLRSSPYETSDIELQSEQTYEVFYRHRGSPSWFYCGSFGTVTGASDMLRVLANGIGTLEVVDVMVMVRVMSWSRD